MCVNIYLCSDIVFVGTADNSVKAPQPYKAKQNEHFKEPDALLKQSRVSHTGSFVYDTLAFLSRPI